jgi:ribosomal protein L12E/L44/L45/RPP1/RPP2
VRLSPYQEWNIGSVHQTRLSMSINADVVEQDFLTTTITTPSDPTAKLEGADAHTGDQKDGDVEKETAASGEEGEESDEDLGNLFDL